MQDDSSQMKFIALLTMVFLPITTMAVSLSHSHIHSLENLLC